MSVSASGRWIWYRSIQSVPSRRRLFSTSLTIQRRELPNWFGSSPIVPWTLVASTTESRRPPANALPTISSDSPREYTSAVSMKLIPASSARWMIPIESSWSVFPHAPNIIAPRHSGLTFTPVEPRSQWSIAAGLVHGLTDDRVLGRGDLVQAADRRRVRRVDRYLRVLGRLLEDRGDRLGERVERLLGLGLGRLHHQRLVHEQREVHGRRMIGEVEQPLGEIERLDCKRALDQPAGEGI